MRPKWKHFYMLPVLKKNDIEVVQLLAKEGNSEIRDAIGWTPLHHACFHGNLEIVIHLIMKANCNPNLPTLNGILPLQLACSGSEEHALKIVEFLINTANVIPMPPHLIRIHYLSIFLKPII